MRTSARPGGEPAQRDDLVRKAVVVPVRTRLRQAGGNVDERLVAKVEGRRQRELARVVEAQPAADEARIERGRDEDGGRVALPETLPEEARDVDGRPGHDAALGPRDAVGVVERQAAFDVLGGDERSARQRVPVLAAAHERGGERAERGREHEAVLLEIRLVGSGQPATAGARIEGADQALSRPVDLGERPRRRRPALLPAEPLDVALELPEPRQ